MADQSEESPQKLPASVYLVGALTQCALGMHAPFLATYVLDMGANLAELGAFRSVGNIAPTILQPVWGSTSDKVGQAKKFVAFGTMTGLFMVLLFLWAETPLHMIVMYGVQSILFSIQIPTWQSLIGGLMGEENRGDELGRLGVATNIAALTATLLSGFIAGFPLLIPFIRESLGPLGLFLFPSVEAWREAYYLPFYITAVIGIIASILSLKIKEKPREVEKRRKFPPIHEILSKPGDFRRFAFVAVLFSFAMSMAWPYFIVVQRVWLNSTLFEIAIASAVMTVSTVMFTVPFGRLSDKIGRKPLILLGRGLLFLIPIMYAFSIPISDFLNIPGVWVIYIANSLAGFCIASSVNAITAYIYDVAPEEERGSHLAVYNTFTGIIYLSGSLIAGLLGEVFASFIGAYLAVFWMLIISSTLRFIASFFYLFIREPRTYSSNVWRELRSLIQYRRHDTDTLPTH
ncbi:MAG: MFS transporter [Candidatus Thorarchaeota archaeon]|nr:MFS transporter [Candidatus Thorarchaeota archaeon]